MAIQLGSGFYEPRHDALRVDVQPEIGPHREWLTYSIRPEPPVGGRIELHWADRTVGFEVEAASDTQLDRVPAREPPSGVDWEVVASDPVDGNVEGAPDARSLSYAEVGDTTWFRLELHEPADPRGVGVNLVVDVDQNAETGSDWWGGSTGFRFDRVVTLWLQASAGAFWGTAGVSDDASALAGDYRALSGGGLGFAWSDDRRALYVGVPTRRLDDDGALRMIAAVGTNTTWNDNIGDRAPVTVRLSR